MRASTEPQSWAVYQIAASVKEDAARAMCDQRDWSEIERVGAGRHTLIRGHIISEREAELLARGTSGDAKPRPARAKYSPTVAQA